MLELILHGIGDYLLQNDWMALTKKKQGLQGILACLLHCFLYTLPFLIITQSPLAILFIFATHFIIDRTHIIERFLAFRNNADPNVNFGFAPDRPVFITVWLYIITDNLIHLICNHLAIHFL